jgi:hypothetical protein
MFKACWKDPALCGTIDFVLLFGYYVDDTV